MRSNIALIDSRVTGYQALINSLVTPCEVFIIDSESDGLADIATKLQGGSDINALHIISHGSQGALYPGTTTVLDSDNLASYATQLTSIESALTQRGDVFYDSTDADTPAEFAIALSGVNSLKNTNLAL